MLPSRPLAFWASALRRAFFVALAPVAAACGTEADDASPGGSGAAPGSSGTGGDGAQGGNTAGEGGTVSTGGNASGRSGGGSGGSGGNAGRSGSGGGTVGGSGGGGGDAETAGAPDSGDSGAGGGGNVELVGCRLPGGANATAAGGELEAGVWTNVSPAESSYEESYGIAFITVDPCNPGTVYACVDEDGLWKSTDAGSTWEKLGSGEADEGDTTRYLDSPTNVAVDPGDPEHLYATQGVRGSTMGFWISHDGGETWTRPEGFLEVSPTLDVTYMAVDPLNFEHLLVSSHSDDGIFVESRDGGTTWKLHQPPESGQVGSFGVHFLHDPANGQGNEDTWLVQQAHLWRTTDAGANWEDVAEVDGTHEAANTFYSSTGDLYIGGFGFPARSTDNGLTWEILEELPYASYNAFQGDGTSLWVKPVLGDAAPFWTSAESDGVSWQEQPGGQAIHQAPYSMAFDAYNRIVYAGTWDSGLLAMRVTP